MIIIKNSEGVEISQNPQSLKEGAGVAFSADEQGEVTIALDGSSIPAEEIPQAAVRKLESVTATADGTGTGAIDADSTFVTVTSAAATNQVSLPAASAATIGRQIDIAVGANGYELITPASSGNTINTVDGDGTNQLDVAANTLLRCVQVSATGWIAYQITATTITVVAPDND